ncbi:ABC transporter permease [Rhodococcus triatomae]|uniref:NitT/TauT family transport system permease protein n=1 Tax=Rhodococcus triatomae TaxID=300028 RepID=A0A1G8GJB6_9NOCA|nr:ABC transporter permease [Rhodococcus triatomae]QNG20362.1 ABC transporter permease [Rhodococcus triatomae]QNG23722.1 ABC transporter permease [Rhodococcus triatomae]SDH94462.1 NitT/TauT family transport system permease protein [Rhodococcus triatomae]
MPTTTPPAPTGVEPAENAGTRSVRGDASSIRWGRARILLDQVWPPLSALAVVLVLWWAVAVSGVVSRALFPTPIETWDAARAMWNEGVLTTDLSASLGRAAAGFAIGATLGVGVGFVSGRITPIARVVSPVVSFLRPIPVIALVPLATAWFGIGEDAKRIVIAYAVFLAVWLYVHDGVARVAPLYLRVSRMFGVGRVRTFRKVLLPGAAPSVVTALRYGSSIAFLALVAAELGGTQTGIAYRIQVDGQFLQTDRMFVGLIVLGALGASADLVLAAAGRRWITWSAS